jgi:hypothetical protein
LRRTNTFAARQAKPGDDGKPITPPISTQPAPVALHQTLLPCANQTLLQGQLDTPGRFDLLSLIPSWC